MLFNTRCYSQYHHTHSLIHDKQHTMSNSSNTTSNLGEPEKQDEKNLEEKLMVDLNSGPVSLADLLDPILYNEAARDGALTILARIALPDLTTRSYISNEIGVLPSVEEIASVQSLITGRTFENMLA
jgi:hypothetical protein